MKLSLALLISVSSTWAALPARADDIRYSNAATAACLAGAGDEAERRDCAGLSAKACEDATDDGATTYGMIECLRLETGYWDDLLNETYQDLLKQATAMDQANADDPRATMLVRDTLRDMQRDWISFRDKTCTYEYSLWQGGTISGPVSASCFLRMTADQYIYLASSWPGE
ncbi:lysozyme inhibitor LprI family protein [Martelella sp. HB161492]|uniref:lysozyme inhibitor LprI family protein n=1 Tax=Martelella sp. HB161492 TaxID=2720726 RepID=UPI001591B66F|nr:lysozyme inhibitor LprI family protein [Martelella sp. HB161492]